MVNERSQLNTFLDVLINKVIDEFKIFEFVKVFEFQENNRHNIYSVELKSFVNNACEIIDSGKKEFLDIKIHLLELIFRKININIQRYKPKAVSAEPNFVSLSGDIFNSSVDALVNPVNCVGVMGAGLAKDFKEKYPDNYIHYKNICDKNLLKIGTCFSYCENGKYIVNFPTKEHFNQASEYSHIEAGLDALVRHIQKYNIKSIAIPPLGCGLGGLDKKIVKQLIIKYLLKNLESNILVELYNF